MPEAPPDTTTWLGIGFLVLWIVLGAYVVYVARIGRQVRSRVEALEAQRDRPASSG